MPNMFSISRLIQLRVICVCLQKLRCITKVIKNDKNIMSHSISHSQDLGESGTAFQLTSTLRESCAHNNQCNGRVQVSSSMTERLNHTFDMIHIFSSCWRAERISVVYTMVKLFFPIKWWLTCSYLCNTHTNLSSDDEFVFITVVSVYKLNAQNESKNYSFILVLLIT